MIAISSYKEVIIKKDEFNNNQIININTTLENNKNIIFITLRNNDCKIIKNAVVKVDKITCNSSLKTIETIGYVTTNSCGEIALSVEFGCNISYKFSVYNTLI